MAIQSNFPAIKPSLLLDFANTKQLDPRITFTRASTATFYNGVTTAMAEQNLFYYSEQFNQGDWEKAAINVTANAIAAPDGNTTADLMVPTAASANHYVLQNIYAVTGLAYAFSFYAKAGGYNFIQIFESTGFGGSDYANFNLSTGAVGSTSGSLSATITSVGNSWYRCSVIKTATATGSGARFAVIPLNADTASRNPTFTGDGTSGVYLWGAQVEQRSAVSSYTATTTQAITNYIPKLQSAASGVARFDHNPTTGESLGLLIEESRTNLLTYSEQFENWSSGRITLTTNAGIAPDGTQTADSLCDLVGSGAQLFVNQSSNLVASSAYTFSVYLKFLGKQWIRLTRYDTTGAVGYPTTYFDLVNGVVGSTNGGGSGGTQTGTITSVGNGWYRCAISFTSDSGGGSRSVYIEGANGNGVPSYTPVSNILGYLAWGAQLEAGAFNTSYIKTVASQVTRAADAASMTGTNFSSWYNGNEGTLYAEATAAPTVATSGFPVVYITDGNTAPAPQNTYYLDFQSGNARSLCFYSGSLVANLNLGAVTAGTSYKLAGAFQTNNFAASKSGGTAVTDSLGNLSNGQNQMVIGRDIYNGPYTNGTIKKIAYYPIRLSNTNLVALTS